MSRLCRAGLDWEFLLREARRHSVLPLLDRGLRLHDGTRPPAPVRELLRAACRLTQRRNLALTAELLRILAALEDAGIAAVPFKGPVLAALAYGDLALRPFGDLDVLVRERDMARARAALVKRGYLPEFAFSAAGERAFRKAECALQFRHAGRDVVLELHWRLTERYLSVHLPVEHCGSGWRRCRWRGGWCRHSRRKTCFSTFASTAANTNGNGWSGCARWPGWRRPARAWIGTPFAGGPATRAPGACCTWA